MNDLFNLAGKTALVTGCTRGIGLAIAQALAEAGADVVGVSANVSDESSVADAVRQTGRHFHAYRCDLSHRDDVARLCNDVSEAHGIDILVNNAGTIRRAPVLDHSDEEWDHVISLNQTTPFTLARHFGHGMVAAGRGKIIFIASLLSFQGGMFVPGYAASKGAIAQLTKAFANELAPHGVNVNALVPGYISTDNTSALQADPERSAAITARIPAGRWGEPGDLAGAALFLASRSADYVHGTTLVVDGGWLAR